MGEPFKLTVETGFYKLVEQLVAEKLRANSLDETSTCSPTSSFRSTSNSDLGEEPKTTLMICDLPADSTSQMLKDLLDIAGFSSFYDFVYVPLRFPDGSATCFGYGFVNCVSPDHAAKLWHYLDGFSGFAGNGSAITLRWAEKTQGKESLVNTYRNCSVMHRSVPHLCKPILLQDGVEVPFPRPTKKLEKPRLRNRRAKMPGAGNDVGDA